PFSGQARDRPEHHVFHAKMACPETKVGTEPRKPQTSAPITSPASGSQSSTPRGVITRTGIPVAWEKHADQTTTGDKEQGVPPFVSAPSASRHGLRPRGRWRPGRSQIQNTHR
ncbi:MAG TPA: hypothetical protein PKZ22_14250, partial [Accumulibacter sp.]|nr:hypothetical protein [Accumulibacter sp.]